MHNSGERIGRIMKKRSGLSFLELMIALGLLAFLVFSIAILIPLSHARTQSTADKNTAYNLADSMMEKIRALGFADIVENRSFNGQAPRNQGTYYQYPPAPYPRASMTTYYPSHNGGNLMSRTIDYTYSVSAAFDREKDGSEIRDIKKVTVTVYWKRPDDAGQAEHCSVTLSSLMLRR